MARLEGGRVVARDGQPRAHRRRLGAEGRDDRPAPDECRIAQGLDVAFGGVALQEMEHGAVVPQRDAAVQPIENVADQPRDRVCSRRPRLSLRDRGGRDVEHGDVLVTEVDEAGRERRGTAADVHDRVVEARGRGRRRARARRAVRPGAIRRLRPAPATRPPPSARVCSPQHHADRRGAPGQAVGNGRTRVRALVQRVARARVTVDGVVVGDIGPGLCVLVGVTHADDRAAAAKLADKVWRLRIFPDAEGVMNLPVADVGGAVLVVSQFTLYADTRRGRRPSWADAAAARAWRSPWSSAFVAELRGRGARVATGRFGADMQVELVNDGPVTLLLEVAGHRRVGWIPCRSAASTPPTAPGCSTPSGCASRASRAASTRSRSRSTASGGRTSASRSRRRARSRSR